MGIRTHKIAIICTTVFFVVASVRADLYLELGTGLASMVNGSTNAILPVPNVPANNIYLQKPTNVSMPVLHESIMDVIYLPYNWSLSAGVGVYRFLPATIKGQAVISADRLNYQYDASSLALLGQVRIGRMIPRWHLMPYFALYLGMAFNRTTLFAPLADDSVSGFLGGEKSRGISGGVGLGVAYQVSRNLSLAAEWTHLSLGEIKTTGGMLNGDAVSSAKIGKLKVNMLLLRLGYLL